MKVVVVGLWHLGTVTAACLARAGHDVVGLDGDEGVVRDLQHGKPPLFEPGLERLVAEGARSGRLRFVSDVRQGLAGAEVVWITRDTPVSEGDVADTDSVLREAREALRLVDQGCLVIVSSQVRVGSTRSLARSFRELRPGERVSFAYSPENLRLGKAIDVFTSPDRVVVGVEREADKARISELLQPFTRNIVWMSLESAEMTKHALNAFLGTSIAFANEVAAICEQVGADAKEVEQGLKSESRIGPGAYLSPGLAFAGGTLARDVMFLSGLGREHHVPLKLIPAVKESNDGHRGWVKRRLAEMLGSVKGKRVAILGLTYKAGTDTLRRSSSVELALQIAAEGARVQAFDPAIRELPGDLAQAIQLCDTVTSAADGASAIVIATQWPEFKAIDWPSVLARMSQRIIVDAGRFIGELVQGLPGITYAAVGFNRRPVQ